MSNVNKVSFLIDGRKVIVVLGPPEGQWTKIKADVCVFVGAAGREAAWAYGWVRGCGYHENYPELSRCCINTDGTWVGGESLNIFVETLAAAEAAVEALQKEAI